jgi:hypothetical protein
MKFEKGLSKVEFDYGIKWGVGTGGGHREHVPPNFFKGPKVPFLYSS